LQKKRRSCGQALCKKKGAVLVSGQALGKKKTQFWPGSLQKKGAVVVGLFARKKGAVVVGLLGGNPVFKTKSFAY
jgi:hypothetical protein